MIFSVKSLGCGEMKVSRSKPGSVRDPFAEIAEIGAVRRIFVRVDGLSDEHHLPRARRDTFPHFGENIGGRTVVKPAAHMRHDTKRAVVRAAALHGYKTAQMRERIGHAIRRTAQRVQQRTVLA